MTTNTTSTSPGSLRVVREIRAEMIRQDITRDDLAKAVEMSQSALARRMTGDCDLTLTEAARIAAALRVSLVELLRRATPPEMAA